MKPIGRRQFLGAVAGSVALASLGLKRFFSHGSAASVTGPANSSGQKPLKAAVVYYSATGSTAKIAKAIYRGMKSSMDCDLIKLKNAYVKQKKVSSLKMEQYDVVGFGGPIWHFRETANLKLFIHNMPMMNGKLCFPFCTHGAEPIGFFESMRQSLHNKKMTLIGWNDWFGSVYQVLHMPEPYLTNGHPDDIDLKDAEGFGREMAERAKKVMAGDRSVIPAIPVGPEADPLWLRRDDSDAEHGPGPKTGSSFGIGTPIKKTTAYAGGAVAVLASAMGGPGGAGGGPSPMGAPSSRSQAGAPTPSMSGPGSSSVAAAAGNAMGGPEGGGVAPMGGPSGGPPMGGPGGGPPGIRLQGFPKVYPKIDMARCEYPRCDACVEGCPVGAIDMTEAVKGSFASSPLIIKQACVSCGLCEKMCIYDAMTFDDVIPKSKHVIDMKTCTHPKCNICADECPMDCIDFSFKQPVFHSNCEGCDLCYSVCPKDAITVPNLAEAQLRLLMTGPNHPFVKNVEKWEDAGRFRRLIPISEVGFNTPAYKNKNAPRIVVNNATDEVTYCKDACKV